MKGHHIEKCVKAINSPKHLSDREDHFFWLSFSLCLVFLHVFLSSKHQKTQKTPKNISKVLDFSHFTKNTRYCSYNQSSFPWFYTWDFGFRGVDEAFLATIHTPNLLNLFLAFILLFCLNNMIYCFL